MGVDFYRCDNCGEIFSDCGYYVYCYCGKRWCSDECAKEHGYKPSRCNKLNIDRPDNEFSSNERIEKLKCEHKWCEECSFFEEVSCAYCRDEVFDDEEILDYALYLLDKSKEDLILEMRNR